MTANREEAAKLLEKGQALFEDNRIDEAFRLFNGAISLDPDYAEAYIVKAEAHMGMMEMEEAQECIRTYLKFDPDSERACGDLMDIHYESGEFGESLACCDKLIAARSSDPYLFAIKAYLLSHLDRVDESLQYYDRALALKPDFYDACCDKANLLSECGCHGESLAVYNKAISMDPGKAEAYFGAACTCHKLGYRNKARFFMQKAHELEPEDEFINMHIKVMQ